MTSSAERHGDAATAAGANTDGTNSGEVLFEARGACGVITLNRPRAINALNLPMIDAIRARLARWADDDGIAAVVLRGAGARGLCAGGDVRRQRELALGSAQQRAEALRFWHDEYELDYQIATWPKPFVAFMDGLTMGGGVGLSVNATLRVVTPTTKVAMPEMNIGFFPDVGATYRFSRAPGETGTHLVLTGETADAADAVYAGLADVLVGTGDGGDVRGALDAIVERLASGDVEGTVNGAAGAVTAGVGEVPAGSALETDRSWIDACYPGDDPVAIVERLRKHGSADAAAAAETIVSRSPLAVRVALRALRQAERLPDLRAVLDRDDVVARNFTDEPDFHEGVRAQLVDKDRKPRWRHPNLEAVPLKAVDRIFHGT